MYYREKINEAIQLSIQTHEVDQKQKRKGTGISYITHPLTVGIILSRAGANEDVVIAGILHDTIEDSITHKKVTAGMLGAMFGQRVADLVTNVSETNKALPWGERKQEALEKIQTFSHELLLIKAADIISNTTELIANYQEIGDELFVHFNAGKEKILEHQRKLIEAILAQWPEIPLAHDLQHIAKDLQAIETKTA